jgi:hypothetical protein
MVLFLLGTISAEYAFYFKSSVQNYCVRLKQALCGKNSPFSEKRMDSGRKMLYDGKTGHLAVKPII